ncbi:MAG: T9SS type A sorting domain-containing protein [Bacteroidota bacterium]
MKKLLNIFILLIMALTSHSQKMIEEGKFWTYFVLDTTDPGTVPHSLHYTEGFILGPQIMIDDQFYHEVMIPFNFNYEICDVWNAINTYFFVREDSLGRVFVRDTLEEESLIYDFTLEINDSFSSGWNGETMILLEKDSLTLYDGTQRERFIFDNGEEWIRGIGSTKSFFKVLEYEMILLCFKEVDCELSYFNSEGGDCWLSVTDTEDVEAEAQSIGIYPNPTNADVEIQFPRITNTTIELYDFSGKMIHTYQVNSESTINIGLNHLDNGVYFFKIENTFKKIVKIN